MIVITTRHVALWSQVVLWRCWKERNGSIELCNWFFFKRKKKKKKSDFNLPSWKWRRIKEMNPRGVKHHEALVVNEKSKEKKCQRSGIDWSKRTFQKLLFCRWLLTYFFHTNSTKKKKKETGGVSDVVGIQKKKENPSTKMWNRNGVSGFFSFLFFEWLWSFLIGRETSHAL